MPSKGDLTWHPPFFWGFFFFCFLLSMYTIFLPNPLPYDILEPCKHHYKKLSAIAFDFIIKGKISITVDVDI